MLVLLVSVSGASCEGSLFHEGLPPMTTAASGPTRCLNCPLTPRDPLAPEALPRYHCEGHSIHNGHFQEKTCQVFGNNSRKEFYAVFSDFLASCFL